MGAKRCYYLILSVYLALLTCQLVACHLTHSLIILTDSYINLYKILDVSLGILHLKTQASLSRELTDVGSQLKLFGRRCTFAFRRLPLLGSFVNGLFLAALLMSAAIEGLQTCFHADHADGQPSPVLEHPAAYPALLVGTALVGSLLQFLTERAHEMREFELGSRSILDVSGSRWRRRPTTSAEASSAGSPGPAHDPKQPDAGAARLAVWPTFGLHRSVGARANLTLGTSARLHKSLESVPTDCGDWTNISLKSMRLCSVQPEHSSLANITVHDPGEGRLSPRGNGVEAAPSRCSVEDAAVWVRFFVSPVSLVVCALVVYTAESKLIEEIADAGLTMLMVTMLFGASYPPMRKAGKLLLQAAPDDIDLERMEAELRALAASIIDVNEFSVWALTPESNRVGSCQLVIDQSAAIGERDIEDILARAKMIFSQRNIKCTTIEPKFVELSKYLELRKEKREKQEPMTIES